jgi:5'-nucleotidase
VRALVTNDDGIASPGLGTLAAAAVDTGLEVVVAAPSWNSSGASAALTAVEDHGRFLVEPTRLDGLAGVVAHSVEAAPAFIVRAAVHGAFGPRPDLVLSGVNRGPNIGHAVLHSGTVGAVLTASTYGVRAAAFSLEIRGEPRWHTAGGIAREVLAWLVRRDDPIVLNVNVPDVEPGDVRGLEEAHLAPFGMVQTSVTESGEGHVTLSYGEVHPDAGPGTDAARLAQGYACYTALAAACEAPNVRIEGLGPASQRS